MVAYNFDELIHPHLPSGSPLVVVYAPDTSTRLWYVCEFVFNGVLRLPFQITSDPAVALAHSGIVITYAHTPLKGLHLVPGTLLFEHEVDPAFRLPIKSTVEALVPEEMDVLSAVFWFISRYEEWQPFKMDAHGRFGADSSVLAATSELAVPVVDIWIDQLRGAIETEYPHIHLPPRVFRLVSTIDVDNLFAFKNKPLWRRWGATLKDRLNGRRALIKKRQAVLNGEQNDPFDVYAEVSQFCHEKHIPLAWFFLMRGGTRYDRTVTNLSAFKAPMAAAVGYGAKIGLHPSYYSQYNPGQLGAEFDRFALASGGEARYARQHFLRYDIRWTPQVLVASGITVDFTMGFSDRAGFRAGTSHAFKMYDFENETILPLYAVPFCAMDGAYSTRAIPPEKALEELKTLAETIRGVGGNMITVYHERSFDDLLYYGFRQVYFDFHQQLAPISVW
jgi:hypothetical protein